ncbi:MAG: hypothetical protein ACRDV3_02900, partial [Acidothermaceae bacterium]
MPFAPLLARRREVVVLIVAAAIGTIVLGVHYAGQHRAGRLDHAIDLRLQHRLSGHLRFLEHLVRLGDPPTVVLICVVLALVFS